MRFKLYLMPPMQVIWSAPPFLVLRTFVPFSYTEKHVRIFSVKGTSFFIDLLFRTSITVPISIKKPSIDKTALNRKKIILTKLQQDNDCKNIWKIKRGGKRSYMKVIFPAPKTSLLDSAVEEGSFGRM